MPKGPQALASSMHIFRWSCKPSFRVRTLRVGGLISLGACLLLQADHPTDDFQ
jgi:hypothetical protein